MMLMGSHSNFSELCCVYRLSGCLITEEGCTSLALALKSNPSCLKELDLSYNHPGDSGVKLLSDGLKDPHWKLNILRYEVLCLIINVLSEPPSEQQPLFCLSIISVGGVTQK